MNNTQFERSKKVLLNNIEEMLEEPLTPEITPKCAWKKVAECNERGEGTTFKHRTKYDLNCFRCNGYNTKCVRYME